MQLLLLLCCCFNDPTKYCDNLGTFTWREQTIFFVVEREERKKNVSSPLSFPGLFGREFYYVVSWTECCFFLFLFCTEKFFIHYTVTLWVFSKSVLPSLSSLRNVLKQQQQQQQQQQLILIYWVSSSSLTPTTMTRRLFSRLLTVHEQFMLLTPPPWFLHPPMMILVSSNTPTPTPPPLRFWFPPHSSFFHVDKVHSFIYYYMTKSFIFKIVLFVFRGFRFKYIYIYIYIFGSFFCVIPIDNDIYLPPPILQQSRQIPWHFVVVVVMMVTW